MRRTLFVFPRETMNVAQAGASDRVADSERRRLIRDVEKAGLFQMASAGLPMPRRKCWQRFSDEREASSTELRKEIPPLEGSISTARASRGAGRRRSGLAC